MEWFNETNITLYLLLLSALAVGWWLGKRSYTGSILKKNSSNLPSNDYFVGLNYLLNDEPDDAIDIFIESLDISSGTLETHMALGTLLRRRGKVDRSIAVYQDLLGQSGFSNSELNEIKIHLVQSYISAGLLDRAEHLLKELRKEKGEIKIKALIHSANVYQLEKDWLEGVGALTELLNVCEPARRSLYQNLASHFYCELAEQEIEHEHMGKAREYLKQAVSMDKSNARVSMLMGKLESLCGNYKEAIKNYLRVKNQDSSFIADVFSPLVECFEKAEKDKDLRKFIDASIEEESGTSVIIELSRYLEKERGQEQARKFLQDKLAQKSSLRLMLQSMMLDSSISDSSSERELFLQVLKEYIENNAQYQCNNCGFELKSLHWHCPSCSHWGTVKHVKGLLGE